MMFLERIKAMVLKVIACVDDNHKDPLRETKRDVFSEDLDITPSLIELE